MVHLIAYPQHPGRKSVRWSFLKFVALFLRCADSECIDSWFATVGTVNEDVYVVGNSRTCSSPVLVDSVSIMVPGRDSTNNDKCWTSFSILRTQTKVTNVAIRINLINMLHVSTLTSKFLLKLSSVRFTFLYRLILPCLLVNLCQTALLMAYGGLIKRRYIKFEVL